MPHDIVITRCRGAVHVDVCYVAFENRAAMLT